MQSIILRILKRRAIYRGAKHHEQVYQRPEKNAPDIHRFPIAVENSPLEDEEDYVKAGPGHDEWGASTEDDRDAEEDSSQ